MHDIDSIERLKVCNIFHTVCKCAALPKMVLCCICPKSVPNVCCNCPLTLDYANMVYKQSCKSVIVDILHRARNRWSEASSFTMLLNMDRSSNSHSACVTFYFLNDVIEREREVKQVQISWRLCLLHRLPSPFLMLSTAVLSSEKVNNDGYERK